MIRLNQLIIPSLRAFSGPTRTIDSGLASLADSGFSSENGCFFLTDLRGGSTNARLSDFPDRTGYECFVNHVHIDDFVTAEIMSQTLRFVWRVLHNWSPQNPNGPLISIASITDNNATVRFHLKRPNEEWLSAELDGFSEGLLEMSSLDLSFFSLFDR